MVAKQLTMQMKDTSPAVKKPPANLCPDPVLEAFESQEDNF